VKDLEGTYSSGHHCIDTEDKIPPSLPLQKGVPRFAGFGKEGVGEILDRACLVNYGFLSSIPTKTIERSIAHAVRLNEQEPEEVFAPSRLGKYVERWVSKPTPGIYRRNGNPAVRRYTRSGTYRSDWLGRV